MNAYPSKGLDSIQCGQPKKKLPVQKLPLFSTGACFKAVYQYKDHRI